MTFRGLARIETSPRKRAMEEARRLTVELERHNQSSGRPGRYLSGSVESLAVEPEGLRLGGEAKHHHLDVRPSRVHRAGEARPEQVVAVLNNYLGKMAEIVTGYNGTIDEFIGDAILALFGAPIHREDDAERAVVCALQMQSRCAR
jgi:hypothetical protein